MQDPDAASDRFVIAILASLKFPFSQYSLLIQMVISETLVYKMLLCAAPLAPTLELPDMI